MIEKNVFQSWYTRDLHPLLQLKLDQMKQRNPEYTFHLYTDEDMDRFVKQVFGGEIYVCYNRLTNIVAKVDFWRYLVLYTYGGVYIDMDSSIECSLSTFIRDSDQAIITPESNPDLYVQWGMIFQKHHPILKRTIELVVENIRLNRFPHDILSLTGPRVFSRAINQVHFELFDTLLIHKDVRTDTDITYTNGSTSYRIFGVDYNGLLKYKHEHGNVLYENKEHWSIAQTKRPLYSINTHSFDGKRFRLLK